MLRSFGWASMARCCLRFLFIGGPVKDLQHDDGSYEATPHK